MALHSYQGHSPLLEDCAFVAESAELIGRVRLAAEVSVWHGCVLRADLAPIEVGAGTNIQDQSVIHVDRELPTIIGRDVTIGHRAILHACSIGDGSLIGMGAIILDGARIGSGCLIAAGALVPPRKKIPDGSMVMGVPGSVVRKHSDDEIAALIKHARAYVELAKTYQTS